MSVTTVEAFLEHLQKSNLLSAEAWKDVQAETERAATDVSPEQLARQLVEDKLLTRWQTQMLLAGRNAFFLGKYKLLDQLGQGGMGAVFRAEQIPLGRIVAVKVMAKKLVKDEKAVARFRREIEAAAALNHPNVVTALDADEVDGRHFLVMECVKGEDLGSVIKGGKRLPIGEACDYMRQAALGLQHAFEKGLVHRDIKPSNLFVVSGVVVSGHSGSGTSTTHFSPLTTYQIKILDMGLAKFENETAEDGGLTSIDQIMGTPDYISPEQSQDTKHADIRSDIYSLGCTLFRLLTGRLPFTGHNAIEKIAARLMEDAPPLRSLCPEAPVELEAVLKKMLTRDPAARYQTPIEVAEALTVFTELPPASGGRQPPDRKAPAEPLTPTIDLGFERFLQNLATEADDDEELAESTQEVEQTKVSGGRQPPDSSAPPSASPKGAQQPSKPKISRAGKKLQRELQQRKAAERKRMLLVIASVAAFVALMIGLRVWYQAGETLLVVDLPENERDEAIQKRKLAARKIEAEKKRRQQLAALQKRVREGEAPAEPQSFDNPAVIKLRNDLIAFRRKHYGTPEALGAAQQMSRLPWPIDKLKREDIDPQELKAAGQGDPDKAPPELVAVLGDGRMEHWGPANSVAFNSDGKMLASGGQDGIVRLWDSATGHELRTFTGHSNTINGLAFSPNGQLLASVSQDGSVNVWDMRAIQAPEKLGMSSGAAMCVCFSASGTMLAAGGADNMVKLWDLKTGNERYALAGHTGVIRSVAFSHDDALLASAGHDMTIKLWDVATGRETMTLKGHTGQICSVGFTRDDKTLYSASHDNTIKLWDTVTAEQRQTLQCQDISGPAVAWAFSPDDTLVAAESNDNTVKLYDLNAGGQPIATLSGHAGWIRSLAFSPDSRTLASASLDGTVRLWDVATGEERLQRRPDFTCVAVNPNGHEFATGAQNGEIQLRELSSCGIKKTFFCETDGDPQVPSRCTFSPDGTLLAAGTLMGTVYYWNLETGEKKQFLTEQVVDLQITSLMFSPDGKLIAWADQSGSVRIHEIHTGKRIEALFTLFPTRIAFDPQGRLLAGGNRNGQVEIWDMRRSETSYSLSLESNATYSVEFSPDGKLIAAGSYGRLRLWDLSKNQKHFDLGGISSWVDSMSFSPDGTQLAAGGKAGKLLIWDINDFKKPPQTVLDRGSTPQGRIRQVAFTAAGRHLVTANGNGTVYVLRLQEWNVENERR